MTASAVMLGVMVLGESFDWRKGLGMSLFIVGVIVLATSGAHKAV